MKSSAERLAFWTALTTDTANALYATLVPFMRKVDVSLHQAQGEHCDQRDLGAGSHVQSQQDASGQRGQDEVGQAVER